MTGDIDQVTGDIDQVTRDQVARDQSFSGAVVYLPAAVPACFPASTKRFASSITR